VSNTRLWFDSERTPRDYAAALLAMDDKERQRSFFDSVVPSHLQPIVMDHVKTALALGGKQ
jgi:hypothetical protein